eukprot:TRINITY_DN20630_c0_g1_i2.p1 TRINITY_DN20630_c0_g1~~TRINITY_DN20630_c0_g1_i2.p1  ORF type:complete len:502 (+),score=84.44 TRINITY_DN20630_c0_g1_i2:470-1975(+)
MSGIVAKIFPAARLSGTIELASGVGLASTELDSTGKQAAESPSDPSSVPDGGYVEFVCRKKNLSHEDALEYIGGQLGLPVSAIGVRMVAEASGVVTQRVIVRAKDWAKARADALPAECDMPAYRVAEGSIRLSQAHAHAPPLPQPAAASLRCSAVITGVIGSLSVIRDRIDTWAKLGRVANFYPPSHFGLPQSVPPSWILGWHTYCRRDRHACLATISGGVHPSDRRALATLFSRGPAEWREFGSLQQLMSRATPSARSLLHYLTRGRQGTRDADWVGAVLSLYDKHPGHVGESCGAFVKLLWNMYASARLELAGTNVVDGDVVIGHDQALRIHQLGYDAHRVHQGSAAKAPLTSVHRPELSTVVLPLKDFMLCGQDGKTVWPTHTVGVGVAEKLLMTFGLSPSDCTRLQPLLPPDIREVRYRRLAAPIRDLEYFVGAGHACLDWQDGCAGHSVRWDRSNTDAASVVASFTLPISSSPLCALREAILIQPRPSVKPKRRRK